MPNMEIPVMPSTPEAMIACAIYCCDRKVYSMASHPPLNPCCSLGKKKDTCVRRNVKRAKAENGLTDEDIKVEPKQTVMVGNEEFNCKPDFMIGNRIIDAKFPCDTDKLAPKMPTGTGRKNVQDFSRGPAMKTTKELLAYPEMTVDGTPGGEKIGDNVSVMGPKEAAKKKGANCRCS